MEYGASQRHADLIVRELGLCDARPMSTPGAIERQPGDDGEKELASNEATKYRRLVDRLSYTAQDRPGAQYDMKELCRHMAGLRNGNEEALKRMAR